MNRLHYIVDSHNRLVENDSHSNFTFQIKLPPNLPPTMMVGVLRACIPRSYYLVNATYGNTFTLTEDAKTVPIAIPYGNYSYRTFMTAVTAALNAASPNGRVYTITFSETTGKFTFTCTGAASLTFGAITGSGLHEQFGVQPSRTRTTTVQLPYTSDNVVNFRLKDTLQVHSNICSAGKDDCLQDIVIAGLPNFSSLVYNSTEALMNAKLLNTTGSNTYYLRITDEDGQIIDLNGVNCVVTLCIWQPSELLERNALTKYLGK